MYINIDTDIAIEIYMYTQKIMLHGWSEQGDSFYHAIWEVSFMDS